MTLGTFCYRGQSFIDRSGVGYFFQQDQKAKLDYHMSMLFAYMQGLQRIGFFVVNMSKISVVVKHGGRKPVKLMKDCGKL